MAKANNFGVGLMHELAITAAKAGWEPDDADKLSKDENLMRLMRGVSRGTHEIRAVELVVNCDEGPFTPDGFIVEEHRKGGIIEFDAAKIHLYLSREQKSGIIEGRKLRVGFDDRPVLNANVLDYLLKNPRLIPESWRRNENGNMRRIYFWGTIYRRDDGFLFVRCLDCSFGVWRDGIYSLGNDWDSACPAALLAS